MKGGRCSAFPLWDKTRRQGSNRSKTLTIAFQRRTHPETKSNNLQHNTDQPSVIPCARKCSAIAASTMPWQSTLVPSLVSVSSDPNTSGTKLTPCLNVGTCMQE